MAMKQHQSTVGKNDEWPSPRWILESLADYLDPALIEYLKAVVTGFLLVVGVTSIVLLLVDFFYEVIL